MTFGGTPVASFTVQDDSLIYATLGTGATGSITVTGPAGTSAPVNTFTFIPAPAITSFSPASGGTGTSVTITGTAFTGATEVSFGGVDATRFTVNSDSQITAIVGAGASGPVSVKTIGGTATSATNFSFFPAPIINSFTPTSGNTGTTVTISGANFTGTTEVDIDGESVPFTIDDDNTISATVTSTVTTGQLTVMNPGGSTTSNEFFFVYEVPIIIWFTPSQGGPGTVVAISGISFTGATAVTFGDTPAALFTVYDDSTIYATVGNGGTGGITVTGPAGTSAPVNTFTFVPAPAIAAFSPGSGVTG